MVRATSEDLGELTPAALRTAVACFVGAAMNISFLLATMPLFMSPISAEMGWSRTIYSSFAVVIGVMLALSNVLLGFFLDRWGPLRLILPGVPLYALALAALTLLNRDPWSGYVLYGLAAVLHVPCGPIAFQKMVILWFHRRRGLAIGVLSGAAIAVGNVSAPWLARGLIDHFGWRGAYLGLAALVVAINWPLQLLFLRSPEAVPADGAEAQAKPSPSYGVSLKAALLTPQPWLIIGAVLLNAGSTLAISFHLFTLLRDRHVSATLATAVQSMLPVFSVSGYMISGFLMDRVNRPQIAIPFFLTATAGAATVAFASSTPILVLGVAMLGFGAGGDGPVLGYFVARFFGLRAWGQIVALLAAIGSACATGGPLLMALSYDRTGSYHIGLLGAVGAFVLATILVSLVGPYTYTATGEPAEPRVRARKSPTICPTAAP